MRVRRARIEAMVMPAIVPVLGDLEVEVWFCGDEEAVGVGAGVVFVVTAAAGWDADVEVDVEFVER